MTVKQECCLRPIILALRGLRQRIAWATITEVQASYRMKPYLKKRNQRRKTKVKKNLPIPQWVLSSSLSS